MIYEVVSFNSKDQYPIFMWRCLKSLNSTVPNIWAEITVRIALLLIVLLMHVCLQPYMQFITEKELLELKRPRRDSITPFWFTVVLIIVVPLFATILPSILAKNYDDAIQTLLAWSLACCITAFITETGKLAVGRPRPDFFYRCFPNGKLERHLRCTGDLKEVNEGRKSFPSGHSSFSFCSLGFVSMWMCGRLGVLSRSRGQGIRVIACMVPLVMASVLAVSRYCENHHHWEDVFVGSILGYTASYFSYGQYYYPLNSEHSGKPYICTILSDGELFEPTSKQACCTRDFKADINCTNTKKITDEVNKKAN